MQKSKSRMKGMNEYRCDEAGHEQDEFLLIWCAWIGLDWIDIHAVVRLSCEVNHPFPSSS